MGVNVGQHCGRSHCARGVSGVQVQTVLAAVDEDVDESEQHAGSSQSSPAEQVTFGLQRRLEQAQQRALEQLNLEELLFDLQSAVAGAEGGQGLLLG